MPTTMKWRRRFANSANDFDLGLTNPEVFESERLNTLLKAIVRENHRGLSLSSRAVTEFRRWFDQPDTPLKSEAYVLLSNWFMTQSGDRNSTVASSCEDLWDALFACRPLNRLSSPEAGRNHVMIPSEFQSFWRRLLEAQDENVRDGEEPSRKSQIAPGSRTNGKPEVSEISKNDLLRAKFDKAGVHCEVEGSSWAVADFLNRVSSWDDGK